MQITLRATMLLALVFAVAAQAAEPSAGALCGECRAEKVASCGGFLEGITAAPDGTLWALDLTGDRIVSIEGGQCKTRGKTGGMPNGAKFHSDGRLFIAGRQGILVFDTRTEALSVLLDTFEGKPLNGINDLSFDKAGGLYFTVPGGSGLLNPNGRVFYLPAGATAAQLLTDKIAFPNGIAVSPDGRTVLVAEFAAKRVLSLPAATVKGGISLAFVYANTRGGVGPDGIVFDEKGRLFTANLGTGEALVFEADGRPLGSVQVPQGGGRFVTNLIVQKPYLYLTEAEKGEIWRVRLDN